MRQVLFAAVLVSALSTSAVAQQTDCAPTLAAYSGIQTGMSYSQVASIIGCAGSEMSRVELGGTTTVMYMWQGGVFSGNMNATFQDDKLAMKAQFGLK